MLRCLATIYGWFPFPRLKGWLLWVFSARFIVGVMAIIFDRDGRVLLFHHSYDNQRPWGLPSGRVEGKEALEQALRRELLEEGGLVVRVGAITGAYRTRIVQSIRIACLCEIEGGTFRPSAEVLEARFFPLSQLPCPMSATQLTAIREAERMWARSRETVPKGRLA